MKSEGGEKEENLQRYFEGEGKLSMDFQVFFSPSERFFLFSFWSERWMRAPNMMWHWLERKIKRPTVLSICCVFVLLASSKRSVGDTLSIYKKNWIWKSEKETWMNKSKQALLSDNNHIMSLVHIYMYDSCTVTKQIQEIFLLFESRTNIYPYVGKTPQTTRKKIFRK